MKSLLLLLFIACSVICFAQDKLYVSAKSGLSIRETPSTAGKVLGKIPYGAAVTTAYPDTAIDVSVEGMNGTWTKTTYNGLSGYIINSYLFPAPPPKATVKTMKDYLLQLSTPAGAPLVVKRGTMNNVEEGGTEIRKQLYKNGVEHHATTGYEWNHDAWFLPDFSIEQGFQLVRMLTDFEGLFKSADPFPNKTGKVKRGETEYDIKVEAEDIGPRKWVKRLRIEYEQGAYYDFEMFQIGNQLVISFGGGV